MNLESMILLSNKNKFNLSIFLQPLLGVNKKLQTDYSHLKIDKDDKDFFSDRRNFYKEARIMFNELSYNYKDQKNICIKDLSLDTFRNINYRVYEDTGHILEKGNELVAKAIYKNLINCFDLN